MVRKVKAQVKAKTGRPASRDTGEDRRADAVTVIWMLTGVATLAAVSVAIAATILTNVFGDPEKLTPLAKVLPGWFLFCGMTTGALCLALTPVAWYVRKTKPPRSVMITAVVIGLVPFVTILARSLLER